MTETIFSLSEKFKPSGPMCLCVQVRSMEKSTQSPQLCPRGETRCCWRLRCSSQPLKVRWRCWSRNVLSLPRRGGASWTSNRLNVVILPHRGWVPLGRHRAQPQEEDFLQQGGRIRQHLQLQRPSAHRVQPWPGETHGGRRHVTASHCFCLSLIRWAPCFVTMLLCSHISLINETELQIP